MSLSKLSLMGTSHLRPFSFPRNPQEVEMEDGEIKYNFHIHFPGILKCSSFSGLVVMGKFFESDSLKPLNLNIYKNKQYVKHKTNQLKKFVADVQTTNHNACLFVLLSNDYKCFLTDHQGHMLKLSKGAKKRWDDLTPLQRSNYDAYEMKPWPKATRVFIEGQFEKYEIFLKDMLKNSPLEKFHHSTVLERLNYELPYLDLYFAIFNSVLKLFVHKWSRKKTFINKFGVNIKCYLVNVRRHYYYAKPPSSIFLDWEVANKREQTHRKEGALNGLASDWKHHLKAFS